MLRYADGARASGRGRGRSADRLRAVLLHERGRRRIVATGTEVSAVISDRDIWAAALLMVKRYAAGEPVVNGT